MVFMIWKRKRNDSNIQVNTEIKEKYEKIRRICVVKKGYQVGDDGAIIRFKVRRVYEGGAEGLSRDVCALAIAEAQKYEREASERESNSLLPYDRRNYDRRNYWGR